jgi:PAS domain S-box-containing protein
MMACMSDRTELQALLAQLELLPHAVSVHHPDGTVLGGNAAGRRIGLAHLESVDATLPWTDPTRAEWQGDLRVRWADGTDGWFMGTSRRQTIDDQDVLVLSMVDVSERRQWALDAIEGVVQRFRLSWAGSHLPVFLVHVDQEQFGCVLVGNEALQDLVGATGPLDGVHLSELFEMPGTEGRDETDRLVRRLLDAEDAGPAVTSRVRCTDGSTRPVVMGLTAARSPMGRPLFLLGYAIDQTPLVELEAARRRDLVHTEMIYEHGSDVVAVISPDGVFQFIGPSSIDVLGYDRHDLYGQAGLELIHPDDRELAAEALISTASRPGLAPPIHLRIRDGMDAWRPVEMVARNLLDVPEVNGIVLTVRDRSDQERAAQELEERERRYRQIVELATDGIASLDAEQRIVYANGHLERMLGHEPAALVGRSLVDLVVGPDRVAVRGHLESSEHDDERLRVQMLRSDGTAVSVMMAPAVRREGDEVIRAVVWISDLSETEATQARLEQSEQRMRALFEAHPDLIFRLDAAGTYLDFHSTDESLLVMPPEHFVGKTVHRVLSEEYAPGVADRFKGAIDEVIAGAEISTVNYTLELPDGAHHFEARMAPITSDEVIAVVRDISDLHHSEQRRVEHERELVRQQAQLERASLERELERASRIEAMGYLAATMAHDVNNLLGVINNYASAIRRSGTDPVVRRDAEEISAAVGRGAELTQRLLSIGRRPTEPHEVEAVRDLVRDLSENLRGAFDHGVALATDLPADPAHVRGSRPRIEQAVMNLVLNARDAAEAAGGAMVVTLAVEVRHAREWDWRPDGVVPGHYVVISVLDGGGGIPDTVRERIFEPFFSTKDGASSGLGLPIVREVAEQHGGGVGIHAVSVGGVSGTRMELWLPAVAAPARGAPSGHQTDPGDRSVRVLLVDDDADVRRSTRHLLEGMGHRVVDAADADAALAVIGADPVDLVLSDVRMPGTTGPDLLRRIRARSPELPAVFVTGYTDDLTGADDLVDVPVLVKPYAVEELAGLIDQLVLPRAAGTQGPERS